MNEIMFSVITCQCAMMHLQMVNSVCQIMRGITAV